MRLISTALASSALLLLTACAGGTNKLTVSIIDTIPMSLYYTPDDVNCRSDIQQGMYPERPRVKVQVKDSAGKLVAAKNAPILAEHSPDNGCTAKLNFEVPQSDFYEISVSGGFPLETRSETVESSGDSQTVDVTFP